MLRRDFLLGFAGAFGAAFNAVDDVEIGQGCCQNGIRGGAATMITFVLGSDPHIGFGHGVFAAANTAGA